MWSEANFNILDPRYDNIRGMFVSKIPLWSNDLLFNKLL